MLETLKKQVQGIKYLLTHPRQLKWVLTREARFGQRKRSKRDWVEWQKYDAHMHISMMRESSDSLRESELNAARIQIFSDMIHSIGSHLEVLDVGCGEGAISMPLLKMGNKVTSVELPKIAVLAQKCHVPSVVAGDAERLAFAANSYDVVLASEVMEHLWNPQDFLNEAYRVLKADGWLIVETPEGIGGLNYDSHRHYFTVERLEPMLETRFVIREVKRLEATGRAQTPTIILLLRKLATTEN